jgi:biotin carboxyl carrier protein
LKDFDQIQYFEVDQAEFERIYDQYKAGRYEFEVEDTFFDPTSYEEFLQSIRQEAEDFVAKRDAAGKAVTQEERLLLEAWRASQQSDDGVAANGPLEEGGQSVVAPMTSSVWKIKVKAGDVVKEGDVLVILEAMKMEIRECSWSIVLTFSCKGGQRGGRQVGPNNQCQVWVPARPGSNNPHSCIVCGSLAQCQHRCMNMYTTS